MEDRTLFTNTINLHYVVGPNNGPPLVLLHGLTGRLQSWDDLLPDVVPDWQVYAVDLRGHGLSDHPENGYQFSDYAADITAFLREGLPGPAVLVGHSLGAVTALLSATEVGPLARGLILCDPPLFPWHTPSAETPFYAWFSFVEQARRDANTVDQMAEIIYEAMPRLDEDGVRSLAETLWQVAPGAPAAAARDAMVGSFDLRAALEKIDCPALFLQGDRSEGAALWDEDVALIRQAMPQAVIVKVPGVGHMTNLAVGDILAQLQAFRQME